MPFDISFVQIVIVAVIALLVFGPSKLPEIARSAGKGLREFKSAVSMDNPLDTPTAPAPPASQRAVIAAPDEAAAPADEFVRRGDDQPEPPRA